MMKRSVHRGCFLSCCVLALLWLSGCASHEEEYQACERVLLKFTDAVTRGDMSEAAALINSEWTARMNVSTAKGAENLSTPLKKGKVQVKFGKYYKGKGEIIRLYFNVAYEMGPTRGFWMSFAKVRENWRIINLRELVEPIK